MLAIIVWHMYNVHIKKFNQSMWTGRMTEEEMRHEHPLELADLKAGSGQVVETAALRRRKRLYYPLAVLSGLVMLFAVFEFVHGEQTALVTIPPEMAANLIYVPQTPTPLPPTSTATLPCHPHAHHFDVGRRFHTLSWPLYLLSFGGWRFRRA